MTKFGSLAQKQRELEEEMKAAGEEALKEYFLEIFEKFPELKAVRWAQYTPYFNDGDPCEFGICDPYFIIDGFGSESSWEDEDEDESGNPLYYIGAWSLYEWVPDGPPIKKTRSVWNAITRSYYKEEYDYQPQKKGNAHPFYETAQMIASDLQANERLLQLSIGDHAQVTVTRDKFTIEDYQHD